ncbi:MAG: tetratricopeptide repeat protein [Bacteroidaceae bacterium]|nr:tetratricopeptide repeat protein [Bacteroidaceae bacterium]
MKRSVDISRIAFLVVFLAMMAGACTSVRKAASDTELSVADRYRYDMYFIEAINQEQQENYDAAFDLLQHCLSISPKSSSVLYELSTYHTALGEKEKALEYMKQAAENDKENYWYRESLAEAYYNNRQYDEAVSLYEDMYKSFPKRAPELLTKLIELYQATEQYEKEVEAIAELENRFGVTEQTSFEKFRAYWNMNDEQAAFQEMEKLAQSHPNDSYYSLMFADVCVNYARYDEALKVYREVLAEEPDNDLASIGLANYYEKIGQDSLAYAMIDSIIVNGHIPDERRVQLTLQLVSRLEQRKDTVAIMDLFNRSLAVPQTSPEQAKLCAAYLIQHHQPDSVVTPVLYQILQLEPDNEDALKQLLYYAVQHNDTEDVHRCSKALLSYYPDELYAYYYLIITALRNDDNKKAIEWCREGIAHINEESNTDLCLDLYSSLGDLYIREGDMEAGFNAYDSALVYNPAAVGVLNNYAYNLSLVQQDLDKAEQMSSVTIKKEPANSTYLDTYAWILYQKERYEEANMYISQALQNDTTHSAVLLDHAGDIAYRLGDVEKAVDFWRQALSAYQEKMAQKDAIVNDDEKGLLNKLKKKIRQRKCIP